MYIHTYIGMCTLYTNIETHITHKFNRVIEMYRIFDSINVRINIYKAFGLFFTNFMEIQLNIYLILICFRIHLIVEVKIPITVK